MKIASANIVDTLQDNLLLEAIQLEVSLKALNKWVILVIFGVSAIA